MTVESFSDDELLRLMLTGNEAAFAQLYRRHQARIYRFALQMSGERAIAEDATQETFLTLMRDGARFSSTQGSFAAFLYGIARNHLKRIFARESRYVSFDCESPEEMKTAESGFNDPLERLTRGEEMERLRGAILSLPEHYRAVVVLCELHEMSYAETAVALQCPVGTVRSRLNRARALLNKRLCGQAKQRGEKWIAKSLS